MGKPKPVVCESAWSVPPMESKQVPVEISDEDPVVTRPWIVSGPKPRFPVAGRATHRLERHASFTWVGAHGGAGVSSLEAAAGVGVALSQLWPDPSRGWPSPAVVVCRSNMAGIEAAARMLQQRASGQITDVTVCALVLVADSPSKPSRALRARAHEISGAVPEVMRVPWIPAWRDTPYTATRPVRELAAAVVALTEKEK